MILPSTYLQDAWSDHERPGWQLLTGTGRAEGYRFREGARLELHHHLPQGRSLLEIANCEFQGGLAITWPGGLRKLHLTDCTVQGDLWLACRLARLELEGVTVTGRILAYQLRFAWHSTVKFVKSETAYIHARTRRDAQRFHWAAPNLPVFFGHMYT